MNSETSAVAQERELTPDEVERAKNYLKVTRDAVLELLNELSEAQWSFKPASDCWSIAGVMEHLVLIEQAIHGVVARIPSAPEPPADWLQEKVDAFIPQTIPLRRGRVQGPPFLEPTGRWSGPEAVLLFVNEREKTIGLIGTAPALRGHVIPHPMLGPWDGYQWLLSVAAHSARHAGQIREIKAASDFPH